MAIIQLKGYRCERCSHEWVPRMKTDAKGNPTQDEPRVCPKCKSPYWNMPRKADRASR